MASASECDLILVAAPAGYGKSTLLAEWALSDPRRVAWLSLEPRHDDPALLVASMITGLDAIELIDPAVTDTLADGVPDFEGTVFPRLAAELRIRATPSVLVLDDAHHLRSPQALKAVDMVIRALPRGSQAVIGARSEPDLGLGELRAQRRLATLGAPDLAMTRSETADLYRRMDLSVEDDQLDLVGERTEGWPAALYLAGLTLEPGIDSDPTLQRFAGDDRYVVDYLRDAFLAGLSREDLEFLRRTAMLKRLTGSLCDAVLEEEGSGERLRELSRSNLLITPLDRRDEWFRMHALLREALLSELERAEPQRLPTLHARASRWFAEHEEYDSAIDHAIDGGDVAEAGRLVWTNVPGYAGVGRVATLNAWLARFDESVIAAEPTLAVASLQATLSLADGESAERWLEAAKRSVDSAPAAIADALRADILVGDSILARRGMVQAGEDAGAALALYDDKTPWPGVACLIKGIAEHLTQPGGGEASHWLGEATRLTATVPNIRTIALAQRALLDIETDPGSATDLAAQARALIRRYGLGEYPSVALTLAVLAHFRAREGRLDEAHAEVEAAERVLGSMRDFGAFYECETRIAIAWTHMRLANPAAAGRAIDQAERDFERVPDATLLGRWIGDARETLANQRADAGLSGAELRVLQFMPTHLSFREVAERLYVSPNTVKTQAQSIYRKLGASGRTEAVEHARAAGLLDPAEAE